MMLETGWYLRLEGHQFDLADWREAYCSPFDPMVLTDASENVLLFSQELQACTSASEAWEKGFALVGRLNGALALVRAGEPVKAVGIMQVDPDGRVSQHHVMAVAAAASRSRASGTAMRISRDGEPIAEPEPEPTAAQKLYKAAQNNDDIADLLEQVSRANNWFDIYKAIELAETLCGGQHKLIALLGSSKALFKNMRQTANYFRHARYPKPAALTELRQAIDLLHFIARIALNHKLMA